MTPYPKRLIEVDLPIARISAHARREKSIRHGHISTLHIWWARRPLAACRAVILASLWPDPVDLTEWLQFAERGGAAGAEGGESGATGTTSTGPEIRAPRGEVLKPGEGVIIRPKRFLDEARAQMARWARLGAREGKNVSAESLDRLLKVQASAGLLDDPAFLRTLLLDFIADFANWDNSTDTDYLATSRALVQAAHEALGGEPGTRPMVIDPFAGGGSIPLEALRVGADAFASDLNPIPVLLNKVVLEYIPRYGQRLADEVRTWGQWVKEQAEAELAEFYPKDPDGSTPIAYLWARTILSEAPGQGDLPVEVPLMRSLWLAKKAGRKRALRWVRDKAGNVQTETAEVIYQIDGKPTPTRVTRPLLEIFEPKKDSEVEEGTVARGNSTCPVTGYTTKVDSVRAQLKKRRGGAADARLFAAVTSHDGEQGRFYRLPNRADDEAIRLAADELSRRISEPTRALDLVPDEPLPPPGGLGFRVQPYGMTRWCDLFSPRQLLALTTLSRLVRESGARMHLGESPSSQGQVRPPARKRSAPQPSGTQKRLVEAAEALFGRSDPEAALLPISLLIDRLAQDQYGKSGRATYIQFLSDHMELITRFTFRTKIGALYLGLPELKDERGKTIEPSKRGPGGEAIYSFQQVVYHIVRCKLVHECELPLQIRDTGPADLTLRMSQEALHMPLHYLALGLFYGALGAMPSRDGLEGTILEQKALNDVPLLELVGDPVRLLRIARGEAPGASGTRELTDAVQACLALCVDRTANQLSSLSKWHNGRQVVDGLFSRQAISMLWDYPELGAICQTNGYWSGAIDWVVQVLESVPPGPPGQAERASAIAHPLPDDSAAAFVTDPPYYDAVPYSDLSDYFYVWLKRTLPASLAPAFSDTLTPKEDECIVDDAKGKDHAFFERTMTTAMVEGRRVTRPDGVGVVVFAHKSTGGWEAQLKGIIDAGWVITASWPIDTEMGSRLRAMDSAALASSVHLVMRPRENPDGSVARSSVGEWREVLAQLPQRLDEWMPRLAAEGVVGADAIFACLGPALEIFSRYSRVEKASGEEVTLREYLEHVWAAVSSEALSMIFKDADAAGLEPDARLTAMWLWTLGAGAGVKAASQKGAAAAVAEGDADDEAGAEDEEDGASGKKPKVSGFTLEFDAARKIAQGLGIHLEKSTSVVEVKGATARLLPVSERVRHLFGKDADEIAAAGGRGRRPKKRQQRGLFEELEEIEAEAPGDGNGRFGGLEAARPGATVLDKVHQSMVLFASGRGEALRRFLVDDGAGKDSRFWKLAQALSALYPPGTDEKRWVDGVLGRKKGLGL